MKATIFFILFIIYTQCSRCQYHYQGLMNYLENRMLAMEERIALWHEQNNRYNTDLKEFRQQAADLLEKLGKEYTKLHSDLEGAGARVDRVEREMDYIETKNPPKPCVKAEDKMVEQDVVVSERKKQEFFELSVCINIVSSIRAMKILKRLGSPKGVWTKDARSAKVYVFNSTSDNTLYEFNSVRELSASSGTSKGRQITLPSAWNGTGHVVNDGFLYYVSEDSEFRIIKYDLNNGSTADSAVFPVEDHTPVYSLNSETLVDLVADEDGLWALYAAGDTINLAKMDSNSLDIEQMWDTACPRNNAEAAFIVCGTVYVVYNTKPPSRSRVQCVFDVNDMVSSGEVPLVYFPRRYGAHSSLKYNSEERQLYAWDDGYQILYKLALQKKLWAIMPPPEE
ncbi:olfactomedin-like protein 3B isoform X1 [Xyrauchen texanus]|uniref:olfactomedin-like protein 3B isoform X1 n=1 Tax=Xyrauchen texanus TaxID=154827 RepID=UPI0022422FCB|nr:olfactomedin-like protein 3B isoform X1 [Xyrauchen texanus]XP_051947188.1 olfactomedin-like protein 3B isoform X1 [Xyrauchen texanus]XP_051947189.1 olfactomedin-like protein 3B isoform X1 [Xyrauchen texanus]